MRIAVTGSTGKVGRAAVRRLVADGHRVWGLDRTGAAGFDFTQVELTDYGQVLDAVLGVTARHDGLDAIVHLAAIPVNGLVPDAATFHNNLTTTFNVFHAALRAGVDTVVYASSITAIGFPFQEAPEYFPVDEEVALRANNTYGLGKVVEESMANQLVRWRDRLSITALRITNVTEAGDYASFAPRANDPGYRRDLIWSYVDARDVAAAVSAGLEHARPGFEAYNVAAADTGLTVPSAELVRTAFPGTPMTRELGRYETLMCIDKARRELGYEPAISWRDVTEQDSG